MEFEKILRLRQSVRGFSDKQISEDELQKLLLAAQAAPLALGDHRTTHITVVQNSELLEEIRSACQLTSRQTGQKIDPFYGAQTLFFLSATDLSSDHIEYCNVACVIENIILQATALNLGSLYIWGCLRKLRERGEVLAKLQLPAAYELLSALAVGHTTKDLAERELTTKIKVTRL